MDNFESVIDSHRMGLLDFWSPTCQPCKILGTVFEEMAKHNPDIFFGKVNVEESADLAKAFQIRSVPTLMGFKNGELLFEQTGLPNPNQLEGMLEAIRKMEPDPEALELEN